MYQSYVGSPLGFVDPNGLDSWYWEALDWFVDFSSGALNDVTLGASGYVQDQVGVTDGGVNHHSGAYGAGETASTVVSVFAGIPGLLKNFGKLAIKKYANDAVDGVGDGTRAATPNGPGRPDGPSGATPSTGGSTNGSSGVNPTPTSPAGPKGPSGDGVTSPGPHAGPGVPGPPNRNIPPKDRDEVNRQGRERGCHRCGIKTPDGIYVPDHQPPLIMDPAGPHTLYPHCKRCSSSQGGHLRWK